MSYGCDLPTPVITTEALYQCSLGHTTDACVTLRFNEETHLLCPRCLVELIRHTKPLQP